jgi:hypothetical protein
MKYVPRSSWLTPRLGWKLLKHAKEAQQIVSAQNIKPSFIPHPRPTNPTPPATPLKIHKLTREEMVEFQLKGLFYNCDDKYFLGHKCKEKIFLWLFLRMFLMRMLMFPLLKRYPKQMILLHPLTLQS